MTSRIEQHAANTHHEAEKTPAQKRRAYALIGLAVIGAAGLSVYIGTHIEEVEQTIIALGTLGPVMSIILHTAFGASPIPTEPLTVINGVVFGPL